MMHETVESIRKTSFLPCGALSAGAAIELLLD
jgi:hypothetical protein